MATGGGADGAGGAGAACSKSDCSWQAVSASVFDDEFATKKYAH